MAKKAQKAKPAKKVAKPTKPAKKAVAKPAKPAKKAAKPAKKVAPKKAVKPVKKATPKKAVKVVKKAVAKKVVKPAKKVVAKKVSKLAKKVVSKPVAKKVSKPAKKVVSKPVAKKAVKPAKVSKVAKPAPKAVVKPVAKVVAKPVAKVVAKVEPKKAVVAPKVVAPVAKKVEPKRKQEIDLDDDGRGADAPMVVEYKTPSIQRPMGPVPKPHINTDNRTRYADSELKEFKQLILKKLEEARKDFELLKSTLSHKDDHGTDDTSPTFKLLEDGSDVLSKEETAHLASRQEKFIQNLQNALIRIENKTYGICRATGKLISKERLRSVPHATLAIEAKLEQSN